MADVIHLGSRKPLDEVIAEESKRELEEMEAEDAAVTEYQERMLDLLEKLKVLVGQGRLTGLVVLGMDPMTDMFLTEVHLNSPDIERQDLFGYMGLLEMIKIEMSEGASMAPVITSAGAILDPWDQPDQSEFDFEDDE